MTPSKQFIRTYFMAFANDPIVNKLNIEVDSKAQADVEEGFKIYLIYYSLGQKKLIICFSDTARVTFNPRQQKFLLHFQYSY